MRANWSEALNDRLLPRTTDRIFKPDPKVKPRGPHKTKGNRKAKGKVKR